MLLRPSWTPVDGVDRVDRSGQEWTRKARMLGGAGHFSLEGGKVGGDAIDMEVNKGLLAFRAEEMR